MKLLTLNIWGGQIYEPLINFIKEKDKEIDIFCFQEVFNGANNARSIFQDAVMDIFSQLQNILTDYEGYFEASQDNEEGLAVFIKKRISVNKEGDIFVYRWENAMENGDAKTLGRNLQYLEITHNKKTYLVANFHGLWNGGAKIDTPDRIEQSNNIKNFLNSFNGAKIICGDFNLEPNTESMKIIEKDMKNLVKKYNIISTRTKYYTKPVKFADYILISPEIIVKDFKVLPDEVSDHSPLFLKFE